MVNGSSFGSGIVLDDADGIIATCSHVVRDSKNGQIQTPYHDKPIDYEVVARGYEDENDVAILRADLSPLRKGEFLSRFLKNVEIRTSAISSAEPIMLCGYPSVLGDSNLLPVLTAGIVSRFPETEEEAIVVSALLSAGNSGGPCFDGENRLLGLASATQVIGSVEVLTSQGKQLRAIPTNYGFIVPIKHVITLAKEHGLLSKLKQEPDGEEQR